MKFLICAVILMNLGEIFATPQQEELVKKIHETFEKCREKTGVTELQLRDSLYQVKSTEEKAPNCLIACVAKDLGWASDDNKINRDNVMKMLDLFKTELTNINLYDKIVKGIDLCIAEYTGGSDECEAAKMATKCIIQQAKTNGLVAM